ncbi:unnamed protein product [Linum tenue]|uniref:Uncharacterized protein n=1 Tax=Linum tenue TaxID=586396 RepID=A0AAV0KTD6_9ROSI|nr:unnamed protein product [Linum tenue]
MSLPTLPSASSPSCVAHRQFIVAEGNLHYASVARTSRAVSLLSLTLSSAVNPCLPAPSYSSIRVFYSSLIVRCLALR